MTTANDPSDPRLKEAMAHIKAILQRYDLAAHVHLGSATHTEFLYYFPTWSIAQLVTAGGQAGIQIRSNKRDYPNPEAQRRAAAATLHFLLRFRDQAALTFTHIDQLEQRLRDLGWEIEHEPFSQYTPHREQ